MMEEINKLSRKDRERLQRRNEIIHAAAKCFSQKGYNKTTLEEIATEAEFGIGTIYNYFQSKEEIYKHLLESISEASCEIIDEIDKQANSLLEFFRLYTKRIFEFFYEYQDALMILVSYITSIEEKPVKFMCETADDMQHKANQILIRRINDGITNLEIRPVNTEYLMHFYFSVVFPYITRLIKASRVSKNGSNNINIDEHVNFILDILFYGITSDKKRKEFK